MGRLGLAPGNETDVYYEGRTKPGMHSYAGWFHFVGRIDAEGSSISPFDMEYSADTPFRFFFSDSATLLPKSFVGLPVVQMDFVAQVPWVLDEPDVG